MNKINRAEIFIAMMKLVFKSKMSGFHEHYYGRNLFSPYKLGISLKVVKSHKTPIRKHHFLLAGRVGV